MWLKKKQKTEPPAAKPKYEHHRFEVAGVPYHEDGLRDLLEPSDDYTMSAADLKEEYVDGDRIYRDELSDCQASLVPEPTNPHDPNAIRVEIGGNLVGYIKKKETATVRKYIDAPGVTVLAEVSGGPYKELVEDEDGQMKIKKGKAPYAIELDIVIKK